MAEQDCSCGQTSVILALYICLCISLVPKLLCGGGGTSYTQAGNKASLCICICIRSATKKSKQQEGPFSTLYMLFFQPHTVAVLGEVQRFLKTALVYFLRLHAALVLRLTCIIQRLQSLTHVEGHIMRNY